MRNIGTKKLQIKYNFQFKASKVKNIIGKDSFKSVLNDLVEKENNDLLKEVYTEVFC